MEPQNDRREKLRECIEIARKAGNPFLEANLRKALSEAEQKAAKGG